jgi:hypothetical protein
MPVKRTSHRASGGAGGGGINSRATAKVTTYHAGYPGQRVNPGGADQLGQAMGNHTTDGGGKVLPNPAVPMYGGGLVRPGQPALGNEVAYATTAGPGGSRTVMRSGSQGQQGPVAGSPKPEGRPILSEYGPESQTSAARRGGRS